MYYRFLGLFLALLSINAFASTAMVNDGDWANDSDWQASCIKPQTAQAFDYVGCLNKKELALVGNLIQTPFGEFPYPMGLVDKSGQIILPNEYHDIDMPKDWEYDSWENDYSLPIFDVPIVVQKRDLNQDSMFGNLGVVSDTWGIVNTKGEFIVPMGYYDEIGKFYDNGLASVKKLDKYGFVDVKGKLIIPLMYDYAFGFDNGFAPVEQQGKYGVIDAQNNIVIEFAYEHIDWLSDDLFVVKNQGKYALMDKSQILRTGYDYDLIMSLHYGGLYRVRKQGQYGVIDGQGKIIVPISYDNVDIDYKKSSWVDDIIYIKATLGDDSYIFDKQGVLVNR